MTRQATSADMLAFAVKRSLEELAKDGSPTAALRFTSRVALAYQSYVERQTVEVDEQAEAAEGMRQATLALVALNEAFRAIDGAHRDT